MINTSAVATIIQAVSPVSNVTALTGSGCAVRIEVENKVYQKEISILKTIFLIWF
jgi:hypothetical protein